MTVRIDHLLIGRAVPLGDNGVPSGIDKHPLSGPLWLGREGLAGDEQGDVKHHGGPDKAVHHYAFEHYDAWKSEIGARSVLCRPGAFGENFSSCGLDESQVAVGDVFRLGGVLVEVSQGRQPCFKLNIRFGVADMAMRVQQSGRTGWYYRVVEPGFVAAGDRMVLEERRAPEWTIKRLWHAFYIDPLNRDELAGIAALQSLPEGWRRHAERRLHTKAVEDWSKRLWGGADPG